MIYKIIGVFVGLFFILLIGAFVDAAMQPRQPSEEYSLNTSSQDQYGTSVLVGQLQHFFPGNKTRRLIAPDLSPYYSFFETDPYASSNSTDTALQDDLELFDLDSDYYPSFNFIGINEDFIMSEIDIKSLLLHVYQGNDALFLSNDLPLFLKQQLDLEIFRNSDIRAGDAHFNLKYKDGPFIQHEKYEQYAQIVSYPDNGEIIVRNEEEEIIGIKIPVGKGSVTLFTLPVIFTNYYILKSTREVSSAVLKDLKLQDTYYAQFTSGVRRAEHKQPSLLSYIFSQPPLKWAFYTIIFSVLIFMFFKIKREQRVIPIIEAPENNSLKYTETLSNLYLLHRDHKEMALKKMHYFLAMVRQEYFLDIQKLDAIFFERLSAKSKVDQKIIKEMFDQYVHIQNQKSISKNEFLAFSRYIQYFKF